MTTWHDKLAAEAVPGGKLEFRPVPEAPPVNERAAQVAAHHAIVVDPAARTITWLSDQFPDRQKKVEISDRVMGLPGSGIAPEAAGVVLITDERNRGVSFGNLVIVDADNRCLVREKLIPAGALELYWPPEVLDQLTAFDLTVVRKRFRKGGHAANKAFPGSRPGWLLTSPLLAVIVFGAVMVLIAVVALIAAL